MDPRLHQAATLGDLATLKSLLEEDPLLLEKVDLSPSADTPLHIAALAGKIDFVREMLHRRPSFAWELNQDGSSPLHIAAAMGNIEITRQLLSLDSRLCLVKDKLGRTPLHCAAVKGRVEIAGELLSHCYEAVKEVSSRGETALHLAVKNNQFEVLKVLVEKLGEDDRNQLINAGDNQGNTICQLALTGGQEQAQNLLENQSKHLKVMIEATSEEAPDQKLQTALGIKRSDSPSPQQLNQSESGRSTQLWLDVEEMKPVVASLIASVTYGAGLNPPPSIWQQGMKLDFDCMFHKPPKIAVLNPKDRCPAGTFYFFMALNIAGFFSSVFFLISPKNTGVAVLLHISLYCMLGTYMVLSIAMMPNVITFVIIYLVTAILMVVLWSEIYKFLRLPKVGRAGKKAMRKLECRLIKRESSDPDNDSKINDA